MRRQGIPRDILQLIYNEIDNELDWKSMMMTSKMAYRVGKSLIRCEYRYQESTGQYDSPKHVWIFTKPFNKFRVEMKSSFKMESGQTYDFEEGASANSGHVIRIWTAGGQHTWYLYSGYYEQQTADRPRHDGYHERVRIRWEGSKIIVISKYKYKDGQIMRHTYTPWGYQSEECGGQWPEQKCALQ